MGQLTALIPPATTTRRAYLVPRELPPGPASFVGRNAEIEELRNALRREREHGAFLAVIHGAPGVGKSALAITFSHIVSAQFPRGQLFAQMRGAGEGDGAAAAGALIRQFVRALRDPEDEFPGNDETFRKEYRLLTDDRAILFVLDDVPPDLDIAALRSINPACAFIVTCRDVPSWSDVSYEKELGPLPEEDALELLRKTIGSDRVDKQERLSLNLVAGCLGEPQALIAAGTALASRPNWDLGMLLGVTMPALSPPARVRRRRTGSFDAAYAMLTTDEQEALRALGVLHERTVSPWMLATMLGTTEARGNRLASRLADACLIERYTSGSGAPTYVVEESVRDYAYKRAVIEDETVDDGPRLIAEEQANRLHEDRPFEEIGSIDELLQAHGDFTSAISAVRNAMSAAHERDSLPHEAYACAALADLYVDLGDMVSGEDLARQAIEKDKDRSGARANRCLVRIERRRHNLEAAVKYADRGLYQAQTADDLAEQIRILQEKAVALAIWGVADEAEEISAEALRLCKSLGDAGHRLLPGVMWARGTVLFYAHRHSEAAEILGEARRLAEPEELNQPDSGAWIDHMQSTVALAAGDRPMAERYAAQALTTFTSLRNRYGTAHARYQIGQIHFASGHLEDAARSFREALESFRNCGDYWIESEISLELARVYTRSAQIRAAVQLQWDARRGYKQLGRRTEARGAVRELSRTVLAGLRPRTAEVWLRVVLRRMLARRQGGSVSLLVADGLTGAAAILAVYAGLTSNTLLAVLCGAASFLALVAAYAGWAGWRIRIRAAGGVVLHRLRPSVPTYLPRRANLPFFYGRETELSSLLTYHAELRSKSAPRFAPSGPLVIGIHGRPGVGKTAFAQQLALRLAPSYYHGQLYQNMGNAGEPRPPRDILHSLLRQLRWPEAELQGKTADELASIFRAKTAGKRMLILLDACRSAEQLAAVLPGDSKCTVITTSRANLLAGRGQYSLRLGPVTAEEAATIFSTSLGESPMTKVDLVAEAAELCDFQPNALLAAAERARHEGLDQTIDRLRRPEARLDVLRHGGRDVADRIASEYANLERREKEAFLLLTIPESGTFVPWALQPLLGIESAEAANLMASISRVGLLELEGVDPSGFGRYRFSSLVRAFAEDRLRSGELSGDRLAQARDDFRRAYLAGALRVLARLGVKHLPKPRFDVPSYWYPQVRAWDDRVAKQLDFWVNAEFASLVPVVLEAKRHGQLTACWQIAARLGDCYSPSAGHREIRAAFEVAVAAARKTETVAGELRVRLARCGYLTAVHDYSAAVDELTATLSLAKSVHDRAAEAQALRRLGQAWQELGYHDRALEALREARTIAVGNMLRRERRLTELFLEEDEAIRDPSRWAYRSSAHDHAEDVRDNLQFQEKVIADRAARRRRDAAPAGLPKDTPRSAGNLASKYAVEHETVAALLHWPPSEPGPAARSADLRARSDGLGARSAIWLAAQALRSAIRIGLPHAQAQARCDVAEALLRAGQVDDCLDHLAIASRCVRELTHDESQHLTACLQRVRGEALLRRDQPREALAALESTERWLAQREPWAHARVLVLLGNAQRMLPDFPAALAAHTGAAATFAQCRDYAALDRALAELSVTLRLMGSQRSARRLERALVGSIVRPDGSETATPGQGIEVEARRDRKAPEATVGVTELLEVRARRTPRQLWPAGHEGEPLAVRVLLTCDGAEIKPVTAVAKITKGGLDTPLFFKLTPRDAGDLHIRAQVYEDNSGLLLREIETSMTVVEPGRR